MKLEILHLIRKPTKPQQYLNNDPVADLMNGADTVVASPDDIFVDTTTTRPSTSRAASKNPSAEAGSTVESEGVPVISIPDSSDSSTPPDGRPNAPPPSSLFEIGTLRSMAPTPSEVDPTERPGALSPQTPGLPALTESHTEEPELRAEQGSGATAALSEMDRLLKETSNLDAILGETDKIRPLSGLSKDGIPELGDLLKGSVTPVTPGTANSQQK
jgi:hypothetical protein